MIKPMVGTPAAPPPEELMAQKRVAFLIGAPRSGTTWLQLLLARSTAVATANETHLFTGYTRSLFTAWQRYQHSTRAVGLNNLMQEAEYFGLVKRLACAVMLKISDRNPSAMIILEKTPDHVLYWQDILRIFPEAMFVHVVRDPRSVVASLCAAGTDWAAKWASREVLNNCEIWIKYIKESQKLRAATRNFLEIRYEDLQLNGIDTLTSVFSWMGVTVSCSEAQSYLRECDIDNLRSHRLERAPWDLTAEPKGFYRKGGIENWRSELTPRESYLVEHLTRDLMTQYGYNSASQRRKIVLPLIIVSRVRAAISWRLDMRRAQREAQLTSKTLADQQRSSEP